MCKYMYLYKEHEQGKDEVHDHPITKTWWKERQEDYICYKHINKMCSAADVE